MVQQLAQLSWRLKTYLPPVIPEAEHDDFDLEVNKYHLDKNIPKAVNEDGSSKRLDKWWAEVFDIDGYPHLPLYLYRTNERTVFQYHEQCHKQENQSYSR